jgi:hypothetical protein
MAASIKQRLLNLARERREDFNFLLARYAIERLLYRLDRSGRGDDFVLKGSMLFHLGPTPIPHRPTQDVDLMGKGSPDLARMRTLFKGLCTLPVADDGLVFVEGTVRAERIREEEEYEGIRIRVEARLGSARIPVQVDVGFGDALTPRPRRERLATLLELPPPHLRVCPWETMIAEKFQALAALGMANSRMKDFFDLDYLSRTLAFDGLVLARAIRSTFERRRTPLPGEVPLGLSAAFGEDPEKVAQWRAFIRRTRLTERSGSLGAVMGRLRDFLMPPAKASIEERPFRMEWPPSGPWRPKRA